MGDINRIPAGSAFYMVNTGKGQRLHIICSIDTTSDYTIDWLAPPYQDPPEDVVVTMCGHVFCYQCVSDRLTGEDNLCPAPGCKETIGLESTFSQATLQICIFDQVGNAASSSGLTHNEEPSIAETGYISSKIKATLEILNSLCSLSYAAALKEYNERNFCMADTSLNPEKPVKAIVFSQWTGMLDLLEGSLNQSLIQYRRLDGSMSLALRDKAVRDFNTDPEVTVMIMSLKAGNHGLDMVAACHVILLDLWWNPTTEDQAVVRAHRIGHTRPVIVSRLTIKDIVEDCILALQNEMIALQMEQGDFDEAKRLSEKGICVKVLGKRSACVFLFKPTTHEEELEAENEQLKSQLKEIKSIMASLKDMQKMINQLQDFQKRIEGASLSTPTDASID